jgi:hypothetical protein
LQLLVVAVDLDTRAIASSVGLPSFILHTTPQGLPTWRTIIIMDLAHLCAAAS